MQSVVQFIMSLNIRLIFNTGVPFTHTQRSGLFACYETGILFFNYQLYEEKKARLNLRRFACAFEPTLYVMTKVHILSTFKKQVLVVADDRPVCQMCTCDRRDNIFHLLLVPNNSLEQESRVFTWCQAVFRKLLSPAV
jgi:hypothetical protein